MKVINLKTTAAMAILAATAYFPVHSAQANNTYVRASIGGNWLNDADTDPSVLVLESEFERGYVFSGAIGTHLMDNVRIEGELGYRKNNADSLQTVGGKVDASGDASALSFMGNVYYDFTFPEESVVFLPYVMGGLGVSRVNADISTLGVQIVDDKDTVLSYQVGAGVGYQVGENTVLDLGYRYFATKDPGFTDATGAAFDSEYDSHSVMLGLRFTF